jgi:hypothetical protein
LLEPEPELLEPERELPEPEPELLEPEPELPEPELPLEPELELELEPELEPEPEPEPELPLLEPPPELPSRAITGVATRPMASTVTIAAVMFFRLNMMRVLQSWVDKRRNLQE